jgi:uncharacterized protein YfiM (DUF2279 family)
MGRCTSWLLIVFFLSTFFHYSESYGQGVNDSIPPINKKRLSAIVIGSSSIFSLSLLGMNELWYKDHSMTSFHFFDDSGEWLQMDKMGHLYTAYYESIIGIHALRWARVPEDKAVLFGTMFGIVFQLPVEILDGFSEEWGFSLTDLSANIIGASLAFIQEKKWQDQRIQMKFSYSSGRLAAKRPELLGSTTAERIFKDYNSQNYWLSFNPNIITREKKIFPDWLNIAFGYGANNMLGGHKNPPEFEDFKRYRQYYFSFDLNTWHISTGRKGWDILIKAASCIKFPAPALEYNKKKGFVFHPVYF